MKKIFALCTMLTLTLSASAMSYEQARNEALFLTDKMAYELNLTDAQYEAAYEINLDYLMGVTSQADVFGVYWERRNLDLSYILYSWQWDAFRAASYFYRPLYWDAGYWHFGIYLRYPRRDYFYFGRPHFYATYRGGHAWHLHGSYGYYHGHTSHFRPSLPAGRSHFGMRNGYDRGDYRGSRNASSTRFTGRDNTGSIRRSDYGRSQSGRSDYGRSQSGRSDYGRSQSENFNRNSSTSGSFNRSNSGNFSRSTPSRSIGSSSNSGNFSRSTPSRSIGGSSNSGNFSRSSSAPTRSIGGSSSHSAPSRSMSSGGSSSGNGGGHFGRAHR